MCVSPIYIKNPYYRMDKKVLNQSNPLIALHDTSALYMAVGCNHCKECIRHRQMSISQRCELESLDSYPFFITLTYNNEHLPLYYLPDGDIIPYSDYHHVKDLIKRIREHELVSRPLRYIAVSERGSKNSRPHVHLLVFLKKYPGDNDFTPYNLEYELYNAFFQEWRVNVSQSTKKPIYEPLFTFKKRRMFGKTYTNFDCHYIVPSDNTYTEEVGFYISKYITKSNKYEKDLFTWLKQSYPDNYRTYWNVVRSRYCTSRYFGTGVSDLTETSPAISYIKNCISNSKDFPTYFSPFNGKKYGLCPYLCNLFLTDEQKLKYKEYLLAHGYLISSNDKKLKPLSKKDYRPIKEVEQSFYNSIDQDNPGISLIY